MVLHQKFHNRVLQEYMNQIFQVDITLLLHNKRLFDRKEQNPKLKILIT